MTHITVPDQTPFIEFAVTTSQSEFDFDFTYFDKTDLRVTVDGIELTQSDFEVNGTAGYEGGYPGGTLVLDLAVSNCTLQLWSAIPPVRVNDFSEGAGIPARSANTELDRLTAKQRDLRLRFQRVPVRTLANSGTLSVTDAGELFTNQGKVATFTLTLPPASMGLIFPFACVEAFNFVIAAHSGDAISNGGSSGSSLTSSTVGSCLELRCLDGDIWAVVSITGIWA